MSIPFSFTTSNGCFQRDHAWLHCATLQTQFQSFTWYFSPLPAKPHYSSGLCNLLNYPNQLLNVEPHSMLRLYFWNDNHHPKQWLKHFPRFVWFENVPYDLPSRLLSFCWVTVLWILIPSLFLNSYSDVSLVLLFIKLLSG